MFFKTWADIVLEILYLGQAGGPDLCVGRCLLGKGKLLGGNCAT